MTITTSKGKTFNVSWIFGPLRDTNQTMIEMQDDRPLSEIAQDFEGLETVTQTDDRRGQDVVTVYSGYTMLAGINRVKGTGAVRITIEKGAASNV